MTTKQFLLEKKIKWTRIETMQEEMRRNHKMISDLLERNNYLECKMRQLAEEMQKAAETLDSEYG